MADSISNREDIIDSRTVIARIEELESEFNDLQTAADEAAESGDTVAAAEAQSAIDDWEDRDELKALQGLQSEAEGYSDWTHGATLIRDSYFPRYAEELASDISDYDTRKVSWPFTCIDWDRAATELQADYTSVEFDGETYWIR